MTGLSNLKLSDRSVHIEWLSGEFGRNALSGGGQWNNGLYQPMRSGAGAYFDLASLTKAIVTNTLLLQIFLDDFDADWGRFLDLNLRSEIPETALIPSWVDLRLRNLWEHRSGLPAHFYLSSQPTLRQCYSGPRTGMWTRVVGRICEELKNHASRPLQTEYSDLNYWLLGFWIERRRGQSLDQIWENWKKQMGLPAEDLVFRIAGERPVIPTESRNPAGEVNDDNAYWMQGVAPHAGLFGTVKGVQKWIERIHQWSMDRPDLQFAWNKESSSKNRFWLGWDTASREEESQAGSIFAPEDCIGHLGWTGTAFWMSRSRKRYAILLTNRVCPVANEESQKWIREFRKEFFSDHWQSKIEAKWLLH